MNRSEALLDQALRVIPGGVNSPVRAFGAVGGSPPFIARGEGVHVVDADGHRYLDLVCSWGALLLGHAATPVVAAATKALVNGSSFGAPTEAEVLLAEELVARVPSFEKVRLCSSGTESTMHAVRLARGYTGRDLILKLDGCYHGAHDSVLVSAGSGVVTFAKPGSPGIPEAVAANTLVAPFNDAEAVATICAEHGDRLAAILLEPVAGNMGCIPPEPGYLEALRELCDKHGIVLIFDEVMSGFRVDPGSAQGLYGVTPDLSCFGKVVGGGFPLAAFGGRADIMGRLSPEGPVYQAGTLSGNPVAVAAGLAALRSLTPERYARLEQIGQRLDEALAPSVAYHGGSYVRVGGMFTVFFRETRPVRFDQVKECDMDAFGRFFRAALSGGVYLPPSQFEACFLSMELTDDDIDQAVEGMSAALVAAIG
jgi:glutamate-1-semialdehyde 2,1-aminomutase